MLEGTKSFGCRALGVDPMNSQRDLEEDVEMAKESLELSCSLESYGDEAFVMLITLLKIYEQPIEGDEASSKESWMSNYI
ncbi:hypothetical protein KP509_1Z107500 [Ceratopteris richardii]|nr:hypothetical protein KP509_1Z107500 [Ceratopteris richardii]